MRAASFGEGRDLAELTARFAEASQAALAPPQQKAEQKPVEAKGFAQVAEKAQGKDGRLVDDGLSGAGGRGWGGRAKGASRPRPRPSGSTVAPCSACCCSSWRSRPSTCATGCRVLPSSACSTVTWARSMRWSRTSCWPAWTAAFSMARPRCRVTVRRWRHWPSASVATDRPRRAPGAADAGNPQALARPAEALQGQDRSGPGGGAQRHQGAARPSGLSGLRS